MILTVKGFGIVNKAKVDVFMELSCFFNDPFKVGNLTSGSVIWKKEDIVEREMYAAGEKVERMRANLLENF